MFFRLRVTYLQFVIGVVAATGCSQSSDLLRDPPAADIDVDAVDATRGVRDQGFDPAVVDLELNGEGRCAGVLIADDAVLTARHCVAILNEPLQCPPLPSRQINRDREPASIRVFVGDDRAHARYVASGRTIIAPATDSICNADLAVLLLDRSVDGIAPLSIRKTGIAMGATVRTVGFGVRDGSVSHEEKVLRDHVTVVASDAFEFTVAEAACEDTMGGPAIDESTNEIVGIASRSGTLCAGDAASRTYTRTDAYVSLIEASIAQTEYAERGDAIRMGDAGVVVDGAARRRPIARGRGPKPRAAKKPTNDLGSACQSGVDCAAGVCVNKSSHRYCSRQCGRGDRCPAHFRCTPTHSGTSVCVLN